MTPRSLIAALAAALLAAACAHAQDVVAAGTRFHFASSAQAARLASSDDDWTATAGEIQRAAAAASFGRSDLATFKQALAATGLDCPPDQVKRWSTAIRGAAPKLAALQVRLPATVTIACTNGGDGAGAPHTRGSAVFMPLKYSDPAEPDLELMAHELFHIWSRLNPVAATQLYALVGFQPAAEFAWPAEWAAARLSNPDAPHHRHAVHIDTPQGAFNVMPVLVARGPVPAGQPIFAVLDVRLVAVQPAPDGKSSEVVRRGGAPVWFDAFATRSYLEQLGGNTQYVIHPEETIADNVSYLVSGRTVRNPALLERVRRQLAATSAAPSAGKTP